MRVALDLTPAFLGLAGVTRYTLALSDALRDGDDVTIERVRHAAVAPSGAMQRIKVGLGRELVYYPFALERRSRRAGADVVHCPGHFAPRVSAPLVLTIQDAFHWRQPELFTRRGRWYHHALLGGAIRRAARVITPSEYSKGELVELVGVDPERIAIVRYGIEPRFRPGDVDPGWLAGRFAVNGPYVLCVGTLEPRKNIGAAIAAVDILHRRGVDVTLVVAGAAGWGLSDLASAAAATASRVVLAGRVTDEELVRLYQGAALFLFPSLYEGFGFPALEAMACACPVVVSNRGSLPEIAGDAALQVDPSDHEGFATAIERIVGDPALAASLRERGLARSALFEWAACAEAHVAVYREAIADPTVRPSASNSETTATLPRTRPGKHRR